MTDLFGLAFPFFGLIFLGFACGHFVRLPEEGLAWLSFFIIYVALPALFYRIVSQTPFHELANARFILAAVTSTAITAALALAVSLWLRRGNAAEAGVATTVGAYANVGYMAPGLALAAIGPDAATPVAIVFTCDALLFFTLVPMLVAIQRREGHFGTVLLTVLKRVLTHPFNIATFLGVLSAAFDVHPPAALDRMLDFLRNAAAPCALFTLGVTVALRPLKRVPVELPPLLALKLLVQPMIALTVYGAFGPFADRWVETVVLMAALPPALNCFILAKQYGTYVEEASAGVLVGTVLSVATVTGLLYLIQQHMLPLHLFH
ncbi:malonate transporter [Azorhizobium oxalatiphilum]|uniref:Malonate transporter n=1 Tax=Azorhizobium oxalatiphilum TaxID=980631 RepID=A0A917C6N8_9HYPH|nr:AEC family transporter [Azorhizobium oxalatiphilum]GGF73351.1 malonate transporter [Azorhizobium oxalatiphilum]